MKAETRFIRQIQKMASDVEFQSKHVRDGEKRFQADKKTYVFRCYHVHNRKKTHPVRLGGQRHRKSLYRGEKIGGGPFKARQKIKYTAFEELFEQTAASAPKDKRFHGYHLYAVDGMKGELPKNSGIIRKILRN